METEIEEMGPEMALEKDPFQLTVEDVYDISHIVGQDLMKISRETRGVSNTVSELQFKIVRVLEMLETLVNQSSLVTEELRMERDNLKAEVEKLVQDGPQMGVGKDKMVIDLTDPNRPRFTLQELRDVLQERNKLKVQLLVAQDELHCYKNGMVPPNEDHIVTLENESIITSSPRTEETSKEKSTKKRLFSFKQEKHT
ncbi:RILP-like protein 2 [Bombina bombina]|uniref:RILP-like protein 2 n=1 Tax=Bombina bombina TaxID=8345 RepID=UPI00235AF5F4|nr:RILP-like protein 2 [Bombina bombina]XP_053557778.1 RILP-like protein 2 [Bombina bombina]XP_053557779.1 RILP-like protein 2 [Bombina bombina]XP_053557780.1 RILP-like protein 2 [Bombina bombina]XP_053557781.1 RILP-like protein 2 [Bombina bombina]XP_053557782.1 RILP-like protein 2 [Bombina bombina]